MERLKFIVGLDDAGRGPVIGPMVVAGIKLREDRLRILSEMGVRDSKELTAKSRERLAEDLRRCVDEYYIVKMPPGVIDRYVDMTARPGGLNFLEAKAMARVISRLKPDIAYVDASDVDCMRFCEWIRISLEPLNLELIGEHHADKKYPVVSGASILAKVVRDREVGRLKRIYGDFGSGYVTDPRTISFLKNYYLEHGSFPPIARRSWKTLKRIAEEVGQRKPF
ncbi:MAG: ribonuclease HII [Candidatus Bathyarchaeia archaeon]